jgi:hypothetical protein
MRSCIALLALAALVSGCVSGPAKPPTVEFPASRFALQYADAKAVRAVIDFDRIAMKAMLKAACTGEGRKLDAVTCARIDLSNKVQATGRKLDLALEVFAREAILNPVIPQQGGLDMEKVFELLKRGGEAYLTGGGSEADDLAGLLSGITGR